MEKNTEYLINKYLETLTEQEKIVYEIAKKHLGSSFDIERSIGFHKFLQQH